ncbi:CpsD/CapB family tyrosine-protein kinase [Catenovulum sp. SM1970]|uniref:CpsD/CapB family tyrosine-protein kinase n=1 Tax=Marinifaba aquimaris TaxID=2741323 RepID=UPI0015746FCD|nr:CpsD/CapB family tyrosine-protein kinase [Marinifaba aquimaris]NTS76166.1 CpsD/CapB family tyrosine-protein kinase [Marinifaba aquimaris]
MLSALHNEVENIYNQVFARDIQTLAICSTNPREGCTTLAQLLAQRCLLTGNRTLLVDLNSHHSSLAPLLILNKEREINQGTSLLAPPQLIETDKQAMIGIPAPKRKEAILKLRAPDKLKQQIDTWRKDFDCVIIDTTPLSRVNHNNIPGDVVAGSCDASILMVKAGETTEEMVEASLAQLNKQQANIIGTVINDQNNPTLKDELLRKATNLKKAKYIPACLVNRLIRNIHSSKLLNLNI